MCLDRFSRIKIEKMAARQVVHQFGQEQQDKNNAPGGHEQRDWRLRASFFVYR
jgi:hypothetical protein